MLRSINPEQLASLFRTILQIGGGYLVSRGIASEDQVLALSSAGATILVTFWGLWARSDKQLIVSAANVPAVEMVNVDRDTERESRTLTLNAKVSS
jgi:hypothetical protein